MLQQTSFQIDIYYGFIEGAYGKVFKGFLKESGRFIAVKEMNIE